MALHGQGFEICFIAIIIFCFSTSSVEVVYQIGLYFLSPCYYGALLKIILTPGKDTD